MKDNTSVYSLAVYSLLLAHGAAQTGDETDIISFLSISFLLCYVRFLHVLQPSK